jgi:uncharacterized protein
MAQPAIWRVVYHRCQNTMRRRLQLLSVFVVFFGVCLAAVAEDAYVASIVKWRQEKEADLRRDDGWLTLAGLFWLKQGKNSFGSDWGNAIVLPPPAPAHLGDLVLQGTNITLEPSGSAGLLLNGKKANPSELKFKDKPDVVAYRDLSFFIIQRGDRLGVRLRDKNNPARAHFAGMKFYPVDPQYRVEANWIPSDPPKKIAIPTVLGTSVEMPSPGTLEFVFQGAKYRLMPLLESPDSTELFIIFADQTNAKGTYGTGRFLYTDLPKNGKVMLDFNKAENPPCAFTPYATCPLPPKENKLPVYIVAGEQFSGHH